MTFWRKAFAYIGTTLLVIAGPEAAAGKDSKSNSDSPKINEESDHSEPNPFNLTDTINASDDTLILAAAHVNSGPTSHSNVPGHANFSMKLRETRALRPGQIRTLRRKLSAGSPGAAAHVNSGPTTHTNVPGHANFTMRLKNKRQRLNSGQIRNLSGRLQGRRSAVILRRPVGGAAAHVNSGPTTHTNVPGHANFAMKLRNKLSRGQIRTIRQKMSRGGAAAAHVNSGPTTHSNIGNHYNFSKTLKTKTRMNPSQIRGLQRRMKVR